MAISPALRKSLITAAGGGALAIAAVLIPSLEGNSYTPYRDVGGVWTVCNGITGQMLFRGKPIHRKSATRFFKSTCGPMPVCGKVRKGAVECISESRSYQF